ncbi:phage head-tail connector protein [Novosphingobium sp. 1949]|uniref:Phage head-tail connector protein n=1 Tax=Novosphingobium organovorum TaxID=2930092 RepID=A0ABT0BGQ1_9SPHN|nr:phage head-tail connector protein [Novosphingobium organovorum]MCJ2184226.1 phage head-tail connector protein [Novosphingobium organovorum]
MNRVILTPATLPSSALAELKQWLGITTEQDDDALLALLATALDTCEAFTGTLPLALPCEERLNAGRDWTALASRPVQAITALEWLAPDGARSTVSSEAYAAELDADGTGRIRLEGVPQTNRVVVTFTAGLAADWDALPASLRHGLIRLAAHQYRERENGSNAQQPPAAIAALWRPWRRMRLA